MIIDVIEYYSKEGSDDLLPEILFQAGITYYNLGDKPTALKYLQKSLDMLPVETSQKDLRKNVIGKIGELLYSIRLYGEAEPYLKESVEMDIASGDSIRIMNHTYLLGMIKTDAGNLKEAEKYFRESRKLALKIAPHDTLKCDMNLATIKSINAKRDSAFFKLFNTLHNHKDSVRKKTLANGAGIFFRADILDALFNFAQDTTFKITPEISNIAYDILTPELKQSIPQDSLTYYIRRYSKILEKSFRLFLAEPTRFQNSSYNYSLHERERVKAEEKNVRLQQLLFSCIIGLLLLIIIIMCMKYRNKSNLLRLHEALDDLAALRKSLAEKDNHLDIKADSESLSDKDNVSSESALKTDADNYETPNETILKERLKSELLELRKKYSGNYEVPSSIFSSQAYDRLQEYLSNNRAIPDSSSLWKDLDKTISKCCPDFKYRLQLLTGGSLKPADYHLAMLIKCGMTPTQLAILIARTKGTISYRRQSLFVKIFNENLGATAMDDIIHLL